MRVCNSFSVSTFNLRYDNAKDASPWSERKHEVVFAIEAMGSEVVATQEGLPHQISELASLLGPKWAWSGKGRDGNGQGEHCALFYRCDRMRLLEAGTFWLSETPETEGSRSWNAACNRICSWIVLAMHETPHVKSFFSSAHLDHVSALARSESSALIVRKVQDLCKWFHCANAVVMGDFNTTPEFEPACGGHFVESWLRDAYAEAPDRPKQAGGSFHDFSGVAIASIGRIDWIWIGGFVKSRSAGLYTQKKGKFYPSDHFPVFCNLTIM